MIYKYRETNKLHTDLKATEAITHRLTCLFPLFQTHKNTVIVHINLFRFLRFMATRVVKYSLPYVFKHEEILPAVSYTHLDVYKRQVNIPLL